MDAPRPSIYNRVKALFADLSPHSTFVMLLLFSSVALFLWAATAKVDVIVRTEGYIIPAGKSQIVQHLEGGIVRKIMAQEGQVVVAGQPLIELSDVQTRSDLGQEQSVLDSLRGREARLLAELNGHATIVFPEELKDPDVIRVETSSWRARRAQLSEEIKVLQALSEQKLNEISETNSRRQNLVDELALAEKQYRVIDDLMKNNAASEMEVLDARCAYNGSSRK